uniref:Uncharacterized protein n=1 Tax=Nannospalax galili TaxID=1026970 RepID=A0A8C6R3B7_NANGA
GSHLACTSAPNSAP